MTVSTSVKPAQETRRRHTMPFGAEIRNDGKVSFRLWAPAARDVALALQGHPKDTVLPMKAVADGWFEIVTGRATHGSRYRFVIDNDTRVPDPAARYQPDDVHGPSEVIDPRTWLWHDGKWRGRPWEESVIYELHVGSFTVAGTFASARQKLAELKELGVTAIELMPVADFPGRRNWGYDGAYLFAPDSRYGRPEEMKAFVDAAHSHGLMVFLDVVYNHFGPEGNYLHRYAPHFFSRRHHTPWGAAINFDGAQNEQVRRFYIHNALYWLEEYHLDGLRLDAVHAVIDDSQPDILTELADRVQRHFGSERHIHLVLENDHNAAHYLNRDTAQHPRWYVAQWNDDIHHALHVLLTGEQSGYYVDYGDDPLGYLARCLSEGFAYQGEPSGYRDHQARGEPSGHLPATAFVSFLQNHDQVGNRAFGERINTLTTDDKLRAALAVLLLAPSPPLLFMGQEWNSRRPFPFFCDFDFELADKVAEGRRNEFARFAEFSDPAARKRIPDPNEDDTFAQAVLDWDVRSRPGHQKWLDLHRDLLALRRRRIIPRLHHLPPHAARAEKIKTSGLNVSWSLDDGSQLTLLANLGDTVLDNVTLPAGEQVYSTHPEALQTADAVQLPAWSVNWFLDA